MSKKSSIFSSEYAYMLGFLSQRLVQCYFEDGKYSLSEQLKESRVFYSPLFLSKRNWSVVPLWSTNLTHIENHKGEVINLIATLKSHALETKSGAMFYFMVEDVGKLWYADFSNYTLAGKRLDVSENWQDFFSIRIVQSESLGPYPGISYIWTDSERFLIHSDGDNLAFIAGDLGEIQSLLGVGYAECRANFIQHNSMLRTIPDLYLGLIAFCDACVKF